MKWLIGIIVLGALGAGLWFSGLINPWIFPQPPVDDTAQLQQQQTSTSGLPTKDDNSSDQALTQDTAALDAQLQALEQDSASVDASLSDKPVEQAY